MRVFNLSYGKLFHEFDLKSKVALVKRCGECRRVLAPDQDAKAEFDLPMVASVKVKDRESAIFSHVLWTPLLVSSAVCDSLREFGVNFSAYPCNLSCNSKGKTQDIMGYSSVVPAFRHHMDPYVVPLFRYIDCCECGGTSWGQVGYQIPYPFIGEKSNFHFFASDLLSGVFISEDLLKFLSDRHFGGRDFCQSNNVYGNWSLALRREAE